MDRSQGKKLWKAAAMFGYLGMNIGILVVTAVIPLAIISMGEADLGQVATGAKSFKPFSYWLIGIGGITFLVSSLAEIAVFARNRTLQISVCVGFVINVGLAITLLIWGLVPSEDRKSYFQDAWSDAEVETKNLIQSYYSCCGFESSDEYRTKHSSCYANGSIAVLWPDGCYNRLTSFAVQPPEVTNPEGQTETVGNAKVHVLLLAYILSLVVLIAIQFVSSILFIIGTVKYDKEDLEDFSEKQFETYRNDNAIVGSPETISLNGTVPRNESDKAISTISMDLDIIGQSPPEALKEDQTRESHQTKSWHQKIPDAISTTLENGFYWLGELVGRNPKMTILLSLLVTATLSIGMLQRREQPSGSSGFLPEGADIIKEFVAYRQTFPVVDREQVLLVVDNGDNLLTKEKFQVMLEIDRKIRQINGTKGQTFSDLCARSAGTCKERSLFELWGFNDTLLDDVETEDILLKLNGSIVSPVFRDEVDISTILGGVVKDGKGNIVKAKAHRMFYVISRKDDDWEEEFIKVGNSEYEGVSVYVESRGSRVLESRDGYQRELPLLFAGFGLIFVYIILMTGRFSLLEHRTYIAMMGITTAGLSMGAGIGLSAALGFEWSVIHLVAPFLIIGIGVDDMFILIQSWNTVEDDPKLKKLSLSERSGHALKSAGVSITITSVTDLVAFAVGASSDLGSFASFSIYVAVCIILLFLLQCTFFLACTVLDQKRREDRYDACLACCYKHGPDYKQSECSKREIFATFFEDILGKIVQYLPVQIVVILITLVVTGLMGWGFVMLKVGFDPDWYLPQESYLIQFGDQYDTYFSAGQDAAVFVINADFYEEREKLHILYKRLEQNQDTNPKYLKSWFEEYAGWMSSDKNITDIYTDTAYENAQQFYASVREFLQDKGRRFASEVVFRGSVITGSRFRVQHREIQDNVDNVDIMDSIHADCDAVGFSDYAFPFHRIYFNFEIMKVIRTEVYRNLGITLLCVFVMVLPMIASFQMSFWVVICVVFTIIDVAGSMHFAGLTIETSTIITLLLSVGLAVDYAAHIAHKFLILKGSRKMRARVTLGQIGPAVFNGGFSTFLALVLLAGTDTYSYKVFFTVFVCVVGYGLWNGLIFLPCVLGLVGPPPHVTAAEARLSQRNLLRKNKIKHEDEMDEIPPNSYLERT